MMTDQPSVQVYTGNFLNGTDADPSSSSYHLLRKESQSFGPDRQYYHWRGAFTLEAQQYIDAVNNPNFPSVALKEGEIYKQCTSYAFSVAD
jgi:aldose 1-epimerase